MTELLNIEFEVSKIKQNLEKIKDKLDFNSTQTKLTMLNGSIDTLSFKEAYEQLHDWKITKHLDHSLNNSLFILGSIPARLDSIRDRLLEEFEDLILLLEKQTQLIDNLELEVKNKESELENANVRIDELKELMQNEKYDNLQNQIKILTNLIGGKVQPTEISTLKSNPVDNYFTEQIKSPLQAPVIESEKQQVHEEVLEYMKADNLYPLHKIDPIRAKTLYLQNWEFVIPNYTGLTSSDYPKFIDTLEQHSDKPDNYFDRLQEND